MIRTCRSVAVLLLWCVCLPACGPTRYSDPIAKMMDRNERHTTRWEAVAQAEREMYNDPRRIAALKRLVWERGYPVEYSNYAVDQLIAIDEAEAKTFLAKTLVLIEDWETREHVIDQAVKRQWADFVPALVRSYAGRTPVYRDPERPERKAIERLAPGVPVEQAILRVFADDKHAEVTQRAAAWALLHRLTPDQGKLIGYLSQVKGDDGLVLDLRAGAMELGVVPDNMETVTWLRMLRTPAYAGFWSRAREIVGRLSEEQRRGLQLRHLPVLVYLASVQSPILAQSHEQLLAEAARLDAAHEHHLKGPTYDGPMEEYPQDFHHWRGQLAWGDLAVMRAMWDLMGDKAVTSAWFQQASADVKDKSTEFGGLVRIGADGRPVAQGYTPMIRRHDLIYYAPEHMVIDAYIALAHYHFHAQSYTNRRYAGPGRGDLERIADRQQFNGLVLTFIDENSLNVDYYQPGGAVIDLGTIRR